MQPAQEQICINAGVNIISFVVMRRIAGIIKSRR
jgi:hypothetical protein